ncbi:hypothetical protein D9M70_630900 [compost metagenome]
MAEQQLALFFNRPVFYQPFFYFFIQLVVRNLYFFGLFELPALFFGEQVVGHVVYRGHDHFDGNQQEQEDGQKYRNHGIF